MAALRDLPGLDELREAALATLCAGETEKLALIRDKLEIGERLGEVPAETPTVPLQRDLQRLQKRLRLKPSAEERHLDLDLREENGRARSELLRRLHLLGIGWGEPRTVSGKSGTFHEVWILQWRPELSVALIEGLALSPAVPAPEAAAWGEGVLRGSGLLQQTGLWRALDGWLTALGPETFTSLLPLVRRAFSDSKPAEKRAMGERIRKLGEGDAGAEPAANEIGNLDHRRASRTLPVLAGILGVERDG